jgi:hypothetical protein
MTVRTITLRRNALTTQGLAVLDWGDWTGKPNELDERIIVPITCDSDYEHTTFRLMVYPAGKMDEQEPWVITQGDLAELEQSDVNSWWNTTAERMLTRLEQAGFSVAVPEQIAEIPTLAYQDRG